LHTLHTDSAYYFVAGNQVDRLDFEPGVDERSRSAAAVQQLKGPAPQNQSLGFVSPLCRFVNDADGHAIAHKFGRHCHSNRTSADNQNGLQHRYSPAIREIERHRLIF
jgi:hypothetical protein